MARIHINKSGNPGQCKARVSCPFGDMESDHYDTKLEAQVAYELSMEPIQASKAATKSALTKFFNKEETIDYDCIEENVRAIKEWSAAWTDDDHQQLAIANLIGELTAKEPFTERDEATVKVLLRSMAYAQPGYKRQKPANKDEHELFARDLNIYNLASNFMLRKKASQVTFAPIENELTNDRVLGLDNAQKKALKDFNRPSYQTSPSLGYEAEAHFQEAIARVARGDKLAPEEEITSFGKISLLPPASRMLNVLSPDSELYNQELYLRAVYPVHELKKELARLQLDGVSISTFNNGRENGNVYTVIQPDGSARSFSVYEHRNSDSIVINGKENWSGEGLPYAGNSKNAFFAEFSPDERERSAQALAFYLKNASKGELESDEELVNKASKRDWNAILSESIPGFKQWSKERITDTYIEPKDENDEDIIKRLDF